MGSRCSPGWHKSLRDSARKQKDYQGHLLTGRVQRLPDQVGPRSPLSRAERRTYDCLCRLSGGQMSLHHGENVTATHIEREVSSFGPRLFVSLCNAVAWAVSGRQCSSIPSFTERVNVRDSGVDAEWIVLVNNGGDFRPFLRAGRNVFQCKQRDALTRKRDEIVAGLKSCLKGALKDVADKTDGSPDHYAMFTNVDLSHQQKEDLRASVLHGYEGAGPVDVQIVGAAEVAAFLNDLPHIRSAFFVPSRFSTWAKAWEDHAATTLLQTHVPLVGREALFKSARGLVDDSGVRAVVLFGPHQIGKTRMALEVTRHRPTDTVVAQDPRGMAEGDMAGLRTPDHEVVLVIEAPEADDAERFVRCALTQPPLKLIVTLPFVEGMFLPNFGKDSRVACLEVGPLSDSESEGLLAKAGAQFDYSMQSWVVDQAAGNPGVLLMAAEVGEDLRKSSASFLEGVSTAFEKRARRELGDELVNGLALLSVLTHVGVAGEAREELSLICDSFGGQPSLNTVLNAVPKLVRAGLLRVEGSYVSVQPPPLASGLAASVFRGRTDQLCKMHAALEVAARRRLFRRLAYVQGEDVGVFWDRLLSSGGPLDDLRVALADPELLHLVSGVVPERTAALILAGLQEMSFEERLSVAGKERRELMWALEQLLFRSVTSARALQSVAMLAEAESETYGNSATDVFCECFHAYHPQLSLPLVERLRLLKKVAAPDRLARSRRIATQAIAAAFSYSATTLRRGHGVDPLDSYPRMTWEEVFDYSEGLVSILCRLADDPDEEVSAGARDALPQVLYRSSLQSRPEDAIRRLGEATERALSGTLRVDLGHLAASLKLIAESYRKSPAKPESKDDADASERLERSARAVEKLLAEIDDAAFPMRVRRWASRWSDSYDNGEKDEDGNTVFQCQKELRKAAAEAVADPCLLTDEVIPWLCSSQAQKSHMFWHYMGELDTERELLPRVEKLGETDEGERAFSSYFAGMAQVDPHLARARLFQLVTAGAPVKGRALVGALALLRADQGIVEHVLTLMDENRVDPVFVEQRLVLGKWAEPLPPTLFLKLLKGIHRGQAQHAAAVLDFLGMWLYMEKPLAGKLAEFAWGCLEPLPSIKGIQAYNCERVASELAPGDPDRAFRLLDALVRQPLDANCWYPIDSHTQHLFWDALCSLDRRRALDTVLAAAVRDRIVGMRVEDDIRELIDLEQDADTLLEIARRGEEDARVICRCISVEKPGFWSLAFRLLGLYAENEMVESELTSAVYYGKRVFFGPMSAHFAARAEEVELILIDESAPPFAREWLNKLQRVLREAVARERVSEANRQVNR